MGIALRRKAYDRFVEWKAGRAPYPVRSRFVRDMANLNDQIDGVFCSKAE